MKRETAIRVEILNISELLKARRTIHWQLMGAAVETLFAGKLTGIRIRGYDVDYKNVLLVSVLALCFSAPVTGWAEEPTYTVTETQLTQLESIFQQLKTQQQQQAQQIKTLKTQLTASENQIRQSQTSLQKANQSLQESAEEAKRTHDRLERQRDTWAAAAVLILAGVTFH